MIEVSDWQRDCGAIRLAAFDGFDGTEGWAFMTHPAKALYRERMDHVLKAMNLQVRRG